MLLYISIAHFFSSHIILHYTDMLQCVFYIRSACRKESRGCGVCPSVKSFLGLLSRLHWWPLSPQSSETLSAQKFVIYKTSQLVTNKLA